MKMKGIAVWAPAEYSAALEQRAKKLGVSPRDLHLKLLAEGLGMKPYTRKKVGRPRKK